MLMFLEDIPRMLLWKIFKVFRDSFRFYHLYTLLLLCSIHLLNLPLKLQFSYLFTFYLFVYIRRLFESTVLHWILQWNSRNVNLTTLQLSLNFKNPSLEKKNLHCMHNIHWLHIPLISIFFPFVVRLLYLPVLENSRHISTYMKQQCKDICSICL